MLANAYNLENFPIESLANIVYIICICRQKLQQFVQTFLQMLVAGWISLACFGT
jgi:hypothetical protein